MCLQMTAIRPYQKWHWWGDEIVIDPVIRAARPVPNSRRKRYPIDIRAFLSVERNAVLSGAQKEIAAGLPADKAELFHSRARGSFDFRVRAVCGYLARKVRYIRSARGFDCWLFPEETLRREGGDCEDIAFLTAALLEACGVSRACIRVAFGRLIDHRNPKRGGFHVWVVVQREDGGWEILEPGTLNRAAREERPPAARAPARAERGTDLEYVPHYVLNRDHLWRVRASESAAAMQLEDYLGYRLERFWRDFNPRFAVKAHEHIFDTALHGLMTDDQIAAVKRHSFTVDVNVLGYDPRDHFDFAYIAEGWKRVRQRLQRQDLESFALAAHAIGDFYAHSLYAHCVPAPDGVLPLYDPAAPPDPSLFRYSFANLPIPGCAQAAEAAAQLWDGEIISGQWWRPYVHYPDQLYDPAEQALRRCLPDHDAVAVDSRVAPDGMRLYSTVAEYRRQYALRLDAAVRHVRQAGEAWTAQRG